MPATADMIVQERNFLRAQQSGWWEDWQDIGDLMLPAKSDVLTEYYPGGSRTRRLYDSTALWALDTFASHLGAWVTNFQTPFFRLRMQALRQDQESARWLDEVATLMWEEMTVDAAPLPTAVHESYRQYGGMGTGAIFVDELPMDDLSPRLGFRGFRAVSLNAGQYYIAENAATRVDTLYRDVRLTPHQAAQLWGMDALHPSMREMLTEQNGHRRYEPCRFIHGVYPRRGREATQRDNQNMPWAAVWVDEKNKHVVEESGYPWFPFMVYRWEKISSQQPYGFGRGHLTLPEAKTLQLIDRDLLRALPLTLMPPGFISGESRETIGIVSLASGAMNPIASNARFQAYEGSRSLDFSLLAIQERRERILRAFFIDQLAFLPDPQQRTQRTLGELQLRQRQMTRIMGPAFMRLLAEFLNPLIDTTFALMLQAGMFPPPPPVVLEAAQAQQGRINVEYMGPLARAQRDDEVDAIIEGMEFLVRLATETQDPLIVQNVEIDETVRRFLSTRGFPESLIVDRRLMEQIRAESQRALQQRQEQEQLQGIAAAAGDAAPMVQALTEVGGAA